MAKRSYGASRWTEQDARDALAELSTSGESAASFARRRSVSTQRLTYWRKRLPRPETTEFVAVELPGTGWSTKIEIVAAGVVVRVREDLDVDHVARLVEAMGRRVGGAC